MANCANPSSVFYFHGGPPNYKERLPFGKGDVAGKAKADMIPRKGGTQIAHPDDSTTNVTRRRLFSRYWKPELQ